MMPLKIVRVRALRLVVLQGLVYQQGTGKVDGVTGFLGSCRV